MGYVVKRARKDTTRHTAMYIDSDGKARSAGTFDSPKVAKHAWQAAEVKVSEGRGDYLVRGRITFQNYVEQHWLPNLNVELKTLENYHFTVHAHLMHFFGKKKMLNIYVTDIREWLQKLKNNGMSASNRKYCKIVLSIIFNTAEADDIVITNPCAKVKLEKIAPKPIPIITPEQFDQFHSALPDPKSRLLTEVAIETGLRWGELTELRPKDIDFSTRILTVSRAVVQISPQFHPTGGRFHIKDHPKSGKWRRFKIADHLCNKILDFVTTNQISNEDLVFEYAAQTTRKVRSTPPVTLGKTPPNEQGRSYTHGTKSAYTAGKCRCEHCRKSMADYRAERRSQGKDDPRIGRSWDTDGHIPNRWFRDNIIKPALSEACLPVDVRMHMLRHAHASWLLNGGADLAVVKERLGHASITTTERYLHTMDNADESALSAFDKVRNRSRTTAPKLNLAELHKQVPEQRSATDVLAEMNQLQAELGKIMGQPQT